MEEEVVDGNVRKEEDLDKAIFCKDEVDRTWKKKMDTSVQKQEMGHV